MKSFKTHLKEATYKTNIKDGDYQKIRKASMGGKFDHKFSRKTNGDVTFSTKSPNKLASDLEKIISSGENSWKEILNIKEEVAANATASAGVSAKDVKNIGPKKKRKTRPITRNYIEVMGKRKKMFSGKV